LILAEAPFSQELLEAPTRIQVQHVYQNVLSQTTPIPSGRMVTPFPAKAIEDVPGLFKQMIDSYETRTNITQADKIHFTEEEPDLTQNLEAITFSVVRYEPGGFGQGSPFSQEHKNLRPMLREEGEDPSNPGYRLATLGQWFDAIIRLTCWARTNKQANTRVSWLEKIISEYTWWLTMNGISRIFFWGRDEDQTKDIKNNKIYGRPLNYYVRTERLTHVSEKTLEELVVKVGVIGG
jgi:hypothetical protein